MALKYLIHSAVYLPIEKSWEDKSEQKYIGASISGNIYMNQIYTESELLTMYKDNPEFKKCEDLHTLTKVWGEMNLVLF